MTELLYLRDSYLRSFEATVEKVEGGKVVLSATAFYPEGGGQPSDTGALLCEGESHPVVKVKREGGEVVHHCEGELEEGKTVRGEIDWERRYTFMRYHTALHLLARVLYDELGAVVTGNQIGLEKSRLDFDTASFDRSLLPEIEAKTNEAIARGLEVRTYTLPREEAFARLDPEKTRLDLIPRHIREIRLVEIAGFDVDACGGTHVRNTREVGGIEIAGFRSKGRRNKRLEVVLSAKLFSPFCEDPTMNFQKRAVSRRRVAFSFILAFLIIYLMLSSISTEELVENLKKVDPATYAGGLLVFYLSVFLRGVRWKYLLDRVNIRLGLRENLTVYFLSWFFNCLLPAKMGDVYRGYYLRPHFSKVMGRVLLERVVDIVTLVALVGLVSLLYVREAPPQISSAIEAGVLLSLVAVAVIVGLRRINLSRKFLVSFRDGASVSASEVPPLLIASSVIWLLESGRLYLVAGAAGVELGFGVAVLIALAAALLTAFPTPAGLGAVELGIAGLLILFGTGKEAAVSIALLDRLISYWSILVSGGILYALRRG
ncbi:MAG: flippase-like domain-containing protein [Euryarchaeota archaeon]|nr:flippase-like domain-containing protein [Euryarchaeota archaeon]